MNHSHTYKLLWPQLKCCAGLYSPCPEARWWRWFLWQDRCWRSCPGHSSSRWNTWRTENKFRAKSTNSLRQHKPYFGFKNYYQCLLKTRCEKLELKRHGHIYFCSWPYCTFPFRYKMNGSSSCTVTDYLLVFASFFNVS